MVAGSSLVRRCLPPDCGWLVAGYVAIAGFFAVEAVLRKPGAASSLDTSSADRGTTRMIVSAYALATQLPLISGRVRVLRLPGAAGPIGVALQAAGIALRGWSMHTLGTFYTRTLRTEDDQHVVDTGAYRFVRHPGYAGSLLTWAGLGLASRSMPVIVAVAALLGRAYQRRIGAEEELLRGELPGYAEYCRSTKRLIPFVW
jgi:protein-S-isoprenylcysteine O-methyltransferase Ste14